MIYIGNQTSFAAATPLEPFEHALASGFDAFEWFPDKKETAGWDDSDLDQSARQRINALAQAQGIRQSVHARWQANPLQPGSLELFQRDIALARDVGAVLLNIHLYHEKGLPAFVEAIEPLVRLTSEAGLQLSIENTPHHSPEDFNSLFRLLRDLKGAAHVGLCLDLGHANLCAATRNDYLAFVDRLEPGVPILHLHLHENWGDADRHLPLFTGPSARDDSGIRGLLNRLRRRQFSGSIILEQWPQPPALLNNARDRLVQMLGSGRGDLAIGTEARSISGDFADRLAAADQGCRSWREKLDFVRGLLVAEDAPPGTEQLVDIAIYLRFLSAGQIPCAEDGRHFRPAHHARISLLIQERLASLTTPENAFVLRRIHPWLPSSALTFQRAEPLTRIRDIAHRNDIPSDLKREIKHTLQNKLHRCAGPEDLVTSADLLARISAPGAGCSADFVEQFKIFHEELKEFFNARSLDERLDALLPEMGADDAALIRAFLEQKSGKDFEAQFMAFQSLTALRGRLQQGAAGLSSLPAQERLLADIALEDFGFVLLSEVINSLESETSQTGWGTLLKALSLAVANLELSSIEPAEAAAIASELRCWSAQLDVSSRENLLRLKATIDRSRRLAEDHSDRVVSLFFGRVQKLGRALAVPEHAVRVFCDGEIRGQIVFQVSKLASTLLRRLRKELALPAWDVLVGGETTGRIAFVERLGEAAFDAGGPWIVLAGSAEGDEEVPPGVAAIVLAHDMPHLSHLGIRARQAGVVFVACEVGAHFQKLRALDGQVLSLSVGMDRVEWKPACALPVAASRRTSASLPPVRLISDRCWIPLHEATSDCAGGKAAGAGRLEELCRKKGASFKVPGGLVVPFGVMENALLSMPAAAEEYRAGMRDINLVSAEDFGAATQRLRDLLQQVPIPPGIAAGVQSTLGREARFMVRSSANCEDQPDLAGAGLYESVPNVELGGLESTVRQVWASLWTERAALSRKQAGIPHEQAHMAVLIQTMLPSEFSFVLHTVHPLNRNPREAYAEIAVGLGETLASGATRGTPYRLLCDKGGGAVRTLAFANFSHALRLSASGGTNPEVVDYSRVVLSLDESARRDLGRRLARIAVTLETALGAAQDIEGALVRDEIFLVQARPQVGLDAP